MDDSLLSQNFFLVHLHGTIEGVHFPGESYDNVYCKATFRHGPDWSLMDENNGQSKKSSSSKTKIAKDRVFISQTVERGDDAQAMLTWNLPVEATFKSTNVYGWPQLVVSVYGQDALGNDVARGYGWTHVPLLPGHHSLDIPFFSPLSSSLVSRLTQWLVESDKPEFIDAKQAAGNEGRSLVTVESGCGGNGDGHGRRVTVSLNVIMKDFTKYGFVAR